MDDTQFAGVKNTSGAAVRGKHGGVTYLFDKDEIKVLAAGQVEFLLGRNILSSDGKLVTRKYLFQSVPLIEALKHVKAPENKSISEAKWAAEKESALRAKLKAEVLAELKADGGILSELKPAGWAKK